MNFSPIEIAQKIFTKRMMGYDMQEVADFLYALSTQFEEITHERNRLRDALREKELQMYEFKERDKILKDTITTASQMAEKIRLDAEREAKMIVADAKNKAELIARDARDSLGRTYEEITTLKKMRLQFETQLKALVQSHLELLAQNKSMIKSPALTDTRGFEIDAEPDPELR